MRGAYTSLPANRENQGARGERWAMRVIGRQARGERRVMGDWVLSAAGEIDAVGNLGIRDSG